MGAGDLPTPNVYATRTASGHAQVFYLLDRPVHRGEHARVKPLQHLARVSEYYRATFGADAGYMGVLSSNPVHDDYQTSYPRAEPYALADLARVIPKGWRVPRPATTAEGRNNELFAALCKLALRCSDDGLLTWARKQGRRYARRDLTASMQRASSGQIYEWKGITPPASRCWAMTKDRMDALDASGRIHWPKKKTGMPRLKRYPEDLPGVPMADIWTDIKIMHNLSAERLGCSAPGFLDSSLKVITSTLPRPARRNRVALGLDSDSRTSPASTARCTSVETRARRGGVPRSLRRSKLRTHKRFSFHVRMKRSATPLPSGARTKLGELSIPKNATSCWKSSAR